MRPVGFLKKGPRSVLRLYRELLVFECNLSVGSTNSVSKVKMYLLRQSFFYNGSISLDCKKEV